jgi:hypothetical protein
MLDAFVAANREEIIRRCRAKVALRSIPNPTPAELEYGVPRFLDQLVDALRQQHRSSGSEIRTSAARHGHDLQTGLGLGLAMCRWGTEVNGGLISARSLPSHGCVFTVELPRV